MKKSIEILFVIAVFAGGYFLIKTFPPKSAGEKPAPASSQEITGESERAAEEKNSADGQKAEIKNVVLVTLDTVRADHYGFMGYPRNTTPFIDKLASEGIVFKNAFTVVSETTPAHASIFTSLYPFEHHITSNGLPLVGSRTLAEYLKSENFITAGFVSAPYFDGIKNGFDVFNFDGNQNLNQGAGIKRRTADETINKAVEWLGNSSPSDQKIFLWVHLFDAHIPFSEGVNYDGGSNDRLSGDDLADFWVKNQGAVLNFFTGNEKESLSKVMNKYDGELQLEDKQVEKLFNSMSQKDLNKNTLWVITSDHGEGLGSHSYYDHFERVYNEQLKAPIIFYNPEVKNGKTIKSLVENIDILPTLADLIGFKIEGHISGTSLIPLISNPEQKSGDYIFSSRGGVVKVGLNEFATKYLPVKSPQDEEFLGDLYSLQDGNYKRTYSPNDTRGDKLFDLKKDPNELNNLINKPGMRSMADDMENKIQEILKGNMGAVDNGEVRPDKLLEESLRALGY
ncbi:MAG: sulfatase [Parcubacteria group bacterium]|jgi:arylsulfatase A-like enzyme